MAKNIVICCDGTNNEFGQYNTSVVRLYQCLDLDPVIGQTAFYDPGVGTLAAPQFLTKVGQGLSKAAGLAIGSGIFPNVEEVIRFLMVHYQPGDSVYIFGFSRGAYTARMVAGLLRKCGLPRLGNDGLLPYMKALYKIRSDDADAHSKDVSPEFKATFGIQCPVRFLGLWDTVSTVGIVWNPDSFPFTFENDEVEIVRHAIAVDERRGFFRTNRWGAATRLAHNPALSQDILQWWFPGVHSDVGGGYQDGELWKHPFEWIINQAQDAGLHIVEDRRDTFLFGKPTRIDGQFAQFNRDRSQWHRSAQHDEANKIGWKLTGIVPKKHSTVVNGKWKASLQFPVARWRKLKTEELLHRSVIERWRDLKEGYRPENLDPEIMGRLVLRSAEDEKTPAFSYQ